MLTISFLIFYCFEQTSNQINKKSNDNDFVSMNLPYVMTPENKVDKFWEGKTIF